MGGVGAWALAWALQPGGWNTAHYSVSTTSQDEGARGAESSRGGWPALRSLESQVPRAPSTVTVTTCCGRHGISKPLMVPVGALKVNMLIWLQSWLFQVHILSV